MIIRDVIHGSITVDSCELSIVDSKYFQRLRLIRQVGFSENSFPSATHNRFIHSLGAMAVATRVFETVFQGSVLSPAAYQRFRAAVRSAALLHDIGHGPLSHTTEFAMPKVNELGLPPGLSAHFGDSNRKATHEDYTLKMILDSGLTPILEKAHLSTGVKPAHIAGLIEPGLPLDDDFFTDMLGDTSVDFRPILAQIISSELDADRMDYLRRDSLQTGVSYGQFDFNWLVENITFHSENGQCYLCLQHRALYAFEDFLISRFHMFLMVYFHHKSVVFDEMLGQYFASPDCDYALPSNIEDYCEYNDAHLYTHLAKSPNEWAQRITNKKPYQILIELHSGIPGTKTAQIEQKKLLNQLRSDLDRQGIHSLTVTSTSELSKYFGKPGIPLFVRYDNHYSAPSYIPLERCTDLFQRYEEKRSITRIYVSPEDYPKCRDSGKSSPLRYEDLK